MKTKPWYSGQIGLESLKNQLRSSHQERQRDYDYYAGVVHGIAMVNGMDAHVSVNIHEFVQAFGYKQAPLTSAQVSAILAEHEKSSPK